MTPQKGGIERMTDIVVNNLTSVENVECFSAFYFRNELDHTPFYGKLCLRHGEEKKQLYKYIHDNGINMIVNQQIPSLHKIISNLSNSLSLYYVYFQHDRTLLNIKSTIYYYYYAVSHIPIWNSKIKIGIKLIFSPAYLIIRWVYYCYLYRQIYYRANALVLLSTYYINVFLKSALLAEDFKHKIWIINNCVTLPAPANASVLDNKKNEVLIVSRLTEDRKRISLALKIWAKYQKAYPEAKKWLLRIAGDGEFATAYFRLVKKHKVPNVIFEGQVDSTIEFYRNASVFIMTSDSEGWGLTLMEAQQMGCVPIAFASYESIYEIIQDHVNGILVKEKDTNDFVQKLNWLLNNNVRRNEMAINCLAIQKKFPTEKMIQQWVSLLRDAEKFLSK